MRKQAELYLTDLYYNPNSSYYDQGNRIRNYNRRLLPLLREEGLVCYNGQKITKRGNIVILWDLTVAGKQLVKTLSKRKNGRNRLQNVLHKIQKYCKR